MSSEPEKNGTIFELPDSYQPSAYPRDKLNEAFKLLLPHSGGKQVPLEIIAKDTGICEAIVRDMRMGLVVLGYLPQIQKTYNPALIKKMWKAIKDNPNKSLKKIAKEKRWELAQLVRFARIGRLVGAIPARVRYVNAENVGQIIASAGIGLMPSRVAEELTGVTAGTARDIARNNDYPQKKRIRIRRKLVAERMDAHYSAQAIAEEADVSESTVRNDIKHINRQRARAQARQRQRQRREAALQPAA